MNVKGFVAYIYTVRHNVVQAEAHQVDLSLYLEEMLCRHTAMYTELDNTHLEQQRLSFYLAEMRLQLDPTVK